MSESPFVDTAVILAGGRNRRFPGLKGFMEVEGVRIIERNLALLKSIFPEVFISTNTPEAYFYLGTPLVGDALPSRGPMTGIYSALVNSKGKNIFAAACDMPFLSREVILSVCESHMRAGGSADATIPVCNNEPQPLLGVYSKTILPALEEGILNSETSLKVLLRKARTNFIAESVIREIDSECMSFVNINTMDDYEKNIVKT